MLTRCLSRQRIWASRAVGARLVAAALLERVRLSCLEGRVSESVACLDRLDRVANEYPAPKPCAWSDIHRYSRIGARARHPVASPTRRPRFRSCRTSSVKPTTGTTVTLACVSAHISLRPICMPANAPMLWLTFRKVLTSGSQVGLYQTILDQGPEIGSLLQSIQKDSARAGDPPDFVAYVDRLVDGYQARYQTQVTASRPSAIAEPLSGREGEILHLIAQGHSNKEIATNSFHRTRDRQNARQAHLHQAQRREASPGRFARAKSRPRRHSIIALPSHLHQPVASAGAR